MQKLLLDDLTVESFATGDERSPSALLAAPALTDGWECGKTLNTCPPQCNTYRETNCV
ncbi:MAG TPA: hypothetical protein VE913_14235 [Longimicrobium sp.]|nr:hypothetical protein [Longimicrobium sp.]